MAGNLGDFIEAVQRKRSCKKTNKYGGEVVRINQTARTKLQQMVDVTKIPKRQLLSYAVAILFDEYLKWRNGDQSANFGYESEIVNEKQLHEVPKEIR